MNISSKSIAVMASLQIAAVFIAYSGAKLGTSIVRRLYGQQEPGPGITQCLAKSELWPLLIPLLWTAIVLARFHHDAPAWEMMLWFTFAALFFVIVGGGGLIAAFAPLTACNFTQ